jgi:hypothetical protein
MPTRNKFWVWPYKQQSRGALAIAHALDGYCILRENSRYQRQDGDVIINWGDGLCRHRPALNQDVNIAIDKIAFYRRLRDTGVVPPFRQRQRHVGLLVALRLAFLFYVVLASKGADGAGIVIARNESEMVPARLYVKLMPKTHEFRVHAGRLPTNIAPRIVLFYTQRKIHEGEGDIWTGDSTLLSDRDYPVPPKVMEVTRTAMEHLPELDFGGFDVIYNEPTDEAWVVEVNSAPMQTSASARKYAEFFHMYNEYLEHPETVPEAEPEVIVADEGNDQHVPVLEASSPQSTPLVQRLLSLESRITEALDELRNITSEAYRG